MQITKEQLDQVAGLLGTDDKAIVFSAVMATLVNNGTPVNDAFDMLFGDGAYVKFAGHIHDALNHA